MRIFIFLFYVLIFLPLQIFISSFQVAYAVLFPRRYVKPGIVGIPLELKTDFGISLLANSLTLTPGTLTLDVSDDRKVLFVHCLALENPDEFIRAVKKTFEEKILLLEAPRR